MPRNEHQCMCGKVYGILQVTASITKLSPLSMNIIDTLAKVIGKLVSVRKIGTFGESRLPTL